MRETIKSRFRLYAGYDNNHKCGDCSHCIRIGCGKRTVYKCKLMGITGSEATDIRLKDCACNWFEREDGSNES